MLFVLLGTLILPSCELLVYKIFFKPLLKLFVTYTIVCQ